MKVFAVLFACVLIAQATVFDYNAKSQWEQFKIQHKKVYSNAAEHEFRFKIFMENLRTIVEHNKEYDEGRQSFKLGVNKYADMLNSEFVDMMMKNERIVSDAVEEQEALPKIELPSSFDWRPKGAVTPIKDQGQCGSCWAFSATGTVEGQNFIKNGKLISLSEQNLMDCSWSYGNMACNGGFENEALQYIADNGGVDTEKSYPYKEKSSRQCRYKEANKGASISGYKNTRRNDEDDLKNAVATIGPISVAIDAGKNSFQFYHSGVYVENRCSSTRLNHAVLAVGYGAEKGKDYWLVKNSWGTSWGDKGYIKMARNHNNMCGIATEPCYPVM